jgi:hypothetical protein
VEAAATWTHWCRVGELSAQGLNLLTGVTDAATNPHCRALNATVAEIEHPRKEQGTLTGFKDPQEGGRTSRGVHSELTKMATRTSQ